MQRAYGRSIINSFHAVWSVGALFGGLMAGKNFFQYIFEKTFHYTKEGWDKFTWSFGWFFVFTAIMNEVVRQTFVDTQIYDVFGFQMDGVNIWILFKIAFIMPLSGLYAWYLTRLMQKYRLDKPDLATGETSRGTGLKYTEDQAHDQKSA